MSNKLYEETHIQNIADAIREKTGKTDGLLVSQMAGEIEGIEVAEDLSGISDLLGDDVADTKDAIETSVSDLLDLANTTTGNTDTNLTDGANALVSGYGQGGIQLPEDMLEGLENGYDVMFYDENMRGLAFYSIKQGHAINPPIYNTEK